MRRKRPWRKVLWFILGLVLAYGVLCWLLADRYLHPGADPLGPVPAGLASRPIPLPSGEISAWATPNIESTDQPTFVLVHGYRGSQSYWHDLAEKLGKDGYAVVVPVLPAHHDPTDDTTGFGTKESERIAALVRWLRERDGENKRKIVLAGVSMGAATCWLASEKAPVNAIVSEGGFSRFDRAALGWLDLALPYGSVLLRPVIWIASARSGIQMASILPVESARRWQGRPALVIQGDQDRVIPMDHAKALAEAADCPIWVVPRARHARCPEVAGPEYLRRLESLANSLD